MRFPWPQTINEKSDSHSTLLWFHRLNLHFPFSPCIGLLLISLCATLLSSGIPPHSWLSQHCGMHVLLCCEVFFVSPCDALILLLFGFMLPLLCSVTVKGFPTQLSLSRGKKSFRNKLEFMVPGTQMSILNKLSLCQSTFSLNFWNVLSNGKKW